MPGTFSPAAFIYDRKIPRHSLRVFCYESVSAAMDGPHYLLSLVFHKHTLDISNSVARHEDALATKGPPDIPFHASPLMYGKEAYRGLDLGKRMLPITSAYSH